MTDTLLSGICKYLASLFNNEDRDVYSYHYKIVNCEDIK